MSNNKNPNLNKFFNKLYISFPNISNIDETHNLINNSQIDNYNTIKYVYTNKESSKWFAKTENDKQEIFLFGKIKNNIPQTALLTLTFDKVLAYSDKCSGIINAKKIYITIQFFNNNFPDFKTELKELTIDIFIGGHANTIDVINLGNYAENITELLKNLDILLEELENYTPIENNETKDNELIIDNNIPKSEFSSDNKKENERQCEICGRKLKKREKKLCRKCSQKRHAAVILKKLLKHINPETPFTKKDLKQIYLEEREINDCIWSLQDYSLINQDNDEYYLVEKYSLDKFIEKYDILDISTEKEELKEEPKRLNKTCSICEKTLPTSKFYRSKNTNDGFEDYCKNCKRYVNTANYLKDILNQVSPGSEFKVTDITNNFKNPMEFIGRLWELQDFDLLTYDSDKDIYLLTDLETCQHFLDEYYISRSTSIKIETKQEKEVKVDLKSEQINSVIESIRTGKTDKEAAEIAGINLYKITHWFNEGKNNSGDENIEFYNRYLEAKKEAKINSINNFYTIESFNNKQELTIADTLRKQQMENVLKEISSGSSMKNAAFNSNITYETLKYWYKRGKQNFGEEYNEFYEKINILQSPMDAPEIKETNLKSNREISKDDFDEEEKLPPEYKDILNPLPFKIKQTFRGVKESESGFAWVRKERNSWRYERQQKDNRQSVSGQNIYELYNEVKRRNYVWGVRDLKKAKSTLKQCGLPKVNTADNVDVDANNLFKHILDPIAPEYAKRFRKPSSSGISWVNKINNTWGYINPREDMRIYDSNLYNLYLKVKKQNLPWGVRDLKKAKETLSTCEKPHSLIEMPEEKNDNLLSSISCAYFENDDITKAIINGHVDNNELISTINIFKEFEKNLIRIITTRHTNSTELFLEFNIESEDLSNFKSKITNLNLHSIKETKEKSKIKINKTNKRDEYSEDKILNGKSEYVIELYNNIKNKILTNFENIETTATKLYMVFKVNNNAIVSIAPLTQFIKIWINSNNLNDYKNKTRDVSNIGHWGVGNYELVINSKEDLDYFMYLFKQCYDEKNN